MFQWVFSVFYVNQLFVVWKGWFCWSTANCFCPFLDAGSCSGLRVNSKLVPLDSCFRDLRHAWGDRRKQERIGFCIFKQWQLLKLLWLPGIINSVFIWCWSDWRPSLHTWPSLWEMLQWWAWETLSYRHHYGRCYSGGHERHWVTAITMGDATVVGMRDTELPPSLWEMLQWWAWETLSYRHH